MLCMLTTKFCCLQEIPPSDSVDQGDEGDWETVGEPAERSRNPAPAMPEVVPRAELSQSQQLLLSHPDLRANLNA
jgi:hypothetical protein